MSHLRVKIEWSLRRFPPDSFFETRTIDEALSENSTGFKMSSLTKRSSFLTFTLIANDRGCNWGGSFLDVEACLICIESTGAFVEKWLKTRLKAVKTVGDNMMLTAVNNHEAEVSRHDCDLPIRWSHPALIWLHWCTFSAFRRGSHRNMAKQSLLHLL